MLNESLPAHELRSDNKKTKLKQWVSAIENNIPAIFLSMLSGKAGIVFLIGLVFISSTYWTHSFVTNSQTSVQYKQELLQKQSKLETNINTLIETISTFDKDGFNDKQVQAQATLFNGYLEIADWLYQLTEQAKKLDLEVEYQLFNAREHEMITDIFIIPIDISVMATRQADAHQTYYEFLRTIALLIEDKKYKRFISASIANVDARSAKLSIKIEVRKKQDNMSITPAGPNNNANDDVHNALGRGI